MPGRAARDALFSGTIHFAQVTFHTNSGDFVIPDADMNIIVQYAQHAIVPIAEYAAQYGPNSVAVSSTLITDTVDVPSGNYSKNDLHGFVNDIASANGIPSNDCIFVVSPQGVSSPDVGGDTAATHDIANLPFIVGGVFAANLTLADDADVYAMLVSHEIAEMVVDPLVDGQNPEVCDPCDINCGNLTQISFDEFDNFLGFNQSSPPGEFPFTYYICAVVKSDGAADCPASAANCQYAPVIQDAQFLILKSTYNKDDLAGSPPVSPAFWMQISGYTNAELGLSGRPTSGDPQPGARHHRRHRPDVQPGPVRRPDSGHFRQPADYPGRTAPDRADRPELPAEPPGIPLPLYDLVQRQRGVRCLAARGGGLPDAELHLHHRPSDPHRSGVNRTSRRPEPVFQGHRPGEPGGLPVLAQLRPALLQGGGFGWTAKRQHVQRHHHRGGRRRGGSSPAR